MKNFPVSGPENPRCCRIIRGTCPNTSDPVMVKRYYRPVSPFPPVPTVLLLFFFPERSQRLRSLRLPPLQSSRRDGRAADSIPPKLSGYLLQQSGEAHLPALYAPKLSCLSREDLPLIILLFLSLFMTFCLIN